MLMWQAAGWQTVGMVDEDYDLINRPISINPDDGSIVKHAIECEVIQDGETGLIRGRVKRSRETL